MTAALKPLPGPTTTTRDTDLCAEVSGLIRHAFAEYQAEHPVSARIYLREASRRIGTYLGGGV